MDTFYLIRESNDLINDNETDCLFLNQNDNCYYNDNVDYENLNTTYDINTDTNNEIQQQQTTAKTQTINVILQTNRFKEMLSDSRLAPNEKERTLNKEALNNYLETELSGLEQQSIKICHKGSNIRCLNNDKSKKVRTNFNYFNAYGECCKTTQCPVKYSFNVKEIIDESYVESHVTIKTKIIGEHKHETLNVLRKNDAIKLGEKIVSQHNGSCFDARQIDMINNEQIYKPHIYSRAKSAFVNKDKLSSDWMHSLILTSNYLLLIYRNNNYFK